MAGSVYGVSVAYTPNQLLVAWSITWTMGTTATVQVANAQGAISGLTIAYAPEGGSATVSGAPLATAGALSVTVTAGSLTAPPVSITPVTLTAPAAPTLTAGTGGIIVSWTAVPQATGYSLALLDAQGAPLPGPPPVTLPYQSDATQALVAASGLIPRASYRIAVTATAGGPSSGPAGPAADIVWPVPPNPLPGLLATLRAAGEAFTLDAALLGSAEIPALFTTLLGLAVPSIALTGVSLASTPRAVTLVGTAALFGVTGAVVTFVFTASPDNALDLVLSASLGPMTVAGMYAADALPGTIYPPAGWATGLTGLANVTVLLSSADRTLAFGGQPTAQPWTLALPNGASLAPLTPAVTATAPPAGPVVWQPRFNTGLALAGATLPIYVAVPSGYSGWRIGLDAPGGLPIDTLAVVNALIGGGSTNNLPASLAGLGSVWLTRLDIEFPPVGSAAWSISTGFAFGQPGTAGTPVWTIIGGVLSIDQIAVDLTWNVFTAGNVTVAVTGTITAALSVLNQPVQAVLPVPPGSAGWTLRTAADIPLLGFAQLAPYLGGDQTWLAGAMSQLGTLGSLTLSELMVRFQPPPNASLLEIRFGIAAAAWTIPAIPWFSVDGATLQIDVAAPTDSANRTMTVEVGATLTIAGTFGLQIAGAYDSAAGTLSVVSSGGSLAVAAVSTLSSIVPAATVTANTPAQMPTGNGVSIGRLAFLYNTAQGTLGSLDLILSVDADWTVIPNALILDDLAIDLSMTWSGQPGDPAVTARILANLELAGVPVAFVADKPQGTAPWTFTASVGAGTTIDLAALLGQTGIPAVLPTGFSFPASITIQALTASLTPDTGAFAFDGEAFVDWSFPFAATTGAITGLTGSLTLPGNGQAGSGQIGGTFSLGGVQGTAAVALGAAAGDIVIGVAVTNAASVSPAAQVNALLGGNAYAAAPAPPDFNAPTFYQAKLVLDLGNDSYLVSGQFSQTGGLYGAVALLVAKPSTSWGFALAASLTNWSFAQISDALAIVDQVLSIQSASAAIAVSSAAGPAGAALAAVVPAFTAASPLVQGLNFTATLNFNGGLLSVLSGLISIPGPVTVQGVIPQASDTSTFTAQLGTVTLLQTLDFSQVVLSYTPSQGQTLTLTGTIGLSLPTASAPAPMTFATSLTVDQTQAVATVQQTSQTVTAPLGIPGLTFAGLGLALTHVFSPASTTMTLSGTVGLGPATLDGSVFFQNGGWAAVSVGIGSPVSIDAVFQQMLGAAWPTGLLAVTFQSGAITYAPAAVTVGGTAYPAGLAASAVVDIYALQGVLLGVAMTPATKSAAASLNATASLPAPIDWTAIVFSDPAWSGKGPQVSLSTSPASFQVSTGITLFGTRFGVATIQVGNAGMTGTLVGDSAVGIFGTPTLSFVWDQNGFRVTNWSLPDLQLPDFSFENIATQTGCGASGVIKSLGIDSTFNLTVDFGISAMPNPALTVTVNGTFGLACNSSAYKGDILTANIVSATLPVPIPLTGAFSWSDLADAFVTCIQDAASSIFDNLLDDPANLAKLLTVGGIQFATDTLVDYLTCEGESAETAGEFAEAAVSGTAASVTLTAFGGGGTVMVGGVVGTLLAGGIFSNSGNSGGGGGQPAPATPGTPSLSWGGGLDVSWPAAADATGYALVYSANGGASTTTSPASGTSATLDLPAGPNYSVAVIAVGPGGVSDPGPGASFQSIGTVTGLAAVFVDPAIDTSWTAVPGATSYGVTVSQNGTPLSPPAAVTPTGAGATITAAPFAAGGSFTVTVAAVGAAMTGTAASTTVSIIAAPAGLALLCEAGGVTASWQAVAGAQGYTLQVLDSQNQPLSPQPPIQVNPSACTAVITPGTQLPNGTAVAVRIQATAGATTGAWSPPVPLTIVWLAAADGLGVVYDQPSATLTASVTPVAQATGYQLQIVGGGTSTVSPVSATLPLSASVAEIAAGTNVTASVRPTAADAVGPWSAGLAVTLSSLASPTGVTVTNTSTGISVAFAPVPDANAYEVTVADTQGNALVPPLSAIGSASPVVITTTQLLGGTGYQVSVRALLATPPLPAPSSPPPPPPP